MCLLPSTVFSLRQTVFSVSNFIVFQWSKVSEGEVLDKQSACAVLQALVLCDELDRNNSSYCFVWILLQLPPVLWSVKSVTTFLLSCQRQTQKRASLKSPSQQQKLWNWHSSRSHHLHRKRYVLNSTQSPLILAAWRNASLNLHQVLMGCWDRAANNKDD